MRENYFKKMRETSDVVNPLILESVEPLKETNKELFDFILNIPAFKKRLEKREKLRPFLLRLAYELVGGKNWEKIAYACASVELLNIATYIDNAVLDNKNDVKESEKINYIISARIVRNIAEETIGKVNKKHSEKLIQLLREIDKGIYISQYKDINQLKKGKEFESFEDFLKNYLERCDGFAGRFMENVCKIGAILAKGIEEQINDIGEIGRNIGIMVQIINDFGDFVPPKLKAFDYEKVYQDQFSDFKQGKLTVPIYYLLEFGKDVEKNKINKFLGKKKIKPEELRGITKILVDSGALEYSKELAIKHATKSKVFLKNFKKSEARDQIKILSEMSRTNKYFANIKERFGEPKRKKEYLTLLNKKREPIGIEEKIKAHKEGKLHQALSIFIFNSKGNLLIQKRAKTKYHSGRLWSNTVCTHPRPEESLFGSAHRRLKEEMGFDCPLKKIFKFHYKTTFENGLIENEIDTVLVGKYEKEPKINPEEVSDFKWISIKELKKDFIKNPQKYTIWFKIALKKYLKLNFNY